MLKSRKYDLSRKFQSIVRTILEKMMCICSADIEFVSEKSNWPRDSKQHVQHQFSRNITRMYLYNDGLKSLLIVLLP